MQIQYRLTQEALWRAFCLCGGGEGGGEEVRQKKESASSLYYALGARQLTGNPYLVGTSWQAALISEEHSVCCF